ncbi:MAG: ferritin-like domain-containing protein [Candidatus Bathyarchaeia archaeon]
MAKEELVKKLNEMLSQEYSSYIRYVTHASLMTGVNCQPVIERFEEIAEEEEEHAKVLRDRIVALGGVPTMQVAPAETAKTMKVMIDIGVKEERKTVKRYLELFKTLKSEDDIILYESIEHILEDDQEHIEELTRLQGKVSST